jgi:ribosomal protein L7/L12
MTDPETLRRLVQLEQRVEHLYAVEAIKQHRAETGLGLAEAKAAIDATRG